MLDSGVNVEALVSSARLAFGHQGDLSDAELLALRVSQLERLMSERKALYECTLRNAYKEIEECIRQETSQQLKQPCA